MTIKDRTRRNFLKSVLAFLGVAGAGFASVPFVSSMQPGKKAQSGAKPVKVDISDLKPNEKISVTWQGMPIYIIRRTEEQVAALQKENGALRDPQSGDSRQPQVTENEHRSIRPDIFVVVAVCTHLGCSPTFKPEYASVDQNWPGGFFCACHGSKFDLAGRVYNKVPAPTNLTVPPYFFIDPTTLVVGASNAAEYQDA
jgi:ubiquinol-cytochrome c reductase iron-sulfur subunit